MTRFRDLLAPDPALTPAEEQRRASAELAHTVAQSHLGWWKDSQQGDGEGRCLLLVVAPFSQYDLTLLDLLDETLETLQSPLPVFVANVQDYSTVDQLRAEFPGIGDVPQTPIAALCESGSAKTVACGKKARDIAAQALGLAADELSRRIVAESRSYSKSLPQAPQRATSTHTVKGAKRESMTEDQQRFLWRCYQEQQNAGGPARDALPYTEDFTKLRDQLNTQFKTTYGDQEVCKALSTLDKNPKHPSRIGIDEADNAQRPGTGS